MLQFNARKILKVVPLSSEGGAFGKRVENMPQNKGPYYITTAIAYTSGKPHIGNTYEVVLADSIARYKRLKGFDVYFQTGTDEHGEKIQIKAEEKGMKISEYIRFMLNKMWEKEGK